CAAGSGAAWAGTICRRAGAIRAAGTGVRAVTMERNRDMRRGHWPVFAPGPLLHVILESLVEAAETPSAIDQLLLSAGPGRVRGGIDIEGELSARLPPRGAGLVARAVVQGDGDEVIIGVDALFHGGNPGNSRKRALIEEPSRAGKP